MTSAFYPQKNLTYKIKQNEHRRQSRIFRKDD